MKICRSCNTKFKQGNFCLICGKPLTDLEDPDKCPKCGKPIVKGAKFCANCGFQIEDTQKKCPQCGNLINPNDKFCSNCGANLSADSIASPSNNDVLKSLNDYFAIPKYPNPINLLGTDVTPTITLDKDKQIFAFSGRSIPEDAIRFFTPILSWIEEYSKNPLQKTEFTFKMGYFNTTTSKIILGMVQKLDKIQKNGSDVYLNWYYHEEDEEMEEFGEVLEELVKIKFKMIPTKEEY